MADTAEEPVEPTPPKNFSVLKASIHCEGCKRKVKKILSQVHGVEFVDVDTKQQKVTVTGRVDAETLIKKLAKSGKHAQLWPQMDVKNDRSTRNVGNQIPKEMNESSQRRIDRQQVNPKSTKNPKESLPSVPAPAKNINGEAVRGTVKKAAAAAESSGDSGGCDTDAGKVDSHDAPTKTSSTEGIEETKQEEEKTDEGCSNAGEQPHAAAKTEAAEKSNSGDGSRGNGGKKKKKPQSEHRAAIAAAAGAAKAEAEAQAPAKNWETGPPPHLTNQFPPNHHQYPPPHHYYTPPPTQPVYAVSYNTAYPMSSHTASYYAAPPPYAHAYMHPGGEVQPAPSDAEWNPRQPLDSFEMFSDENPNGCFVM